eukprot:6903800-Pyramimonas_sp.AAC.3
MRHPEHTMVFCNSIANLRRLAALFRILGVPAVALHANMMQRQRLNVRLCDCCATVRLCDCSLCLVPAVALP